MSQGTMTVCATNIRVSEKRYAKILESPLQEPLLTTISKKWSMVYLPAMDMNMTNSITREALLMGIMTT